MKVMAPCALVPVANTGPLPEEVLKEQVDRVAIFSAVMLGLWTIGLTIDLWLVPFALGRERVPADIALSLCGMLVSAAMYLFVRRSRHPLATKAAAGLAFMIANALEIAVMNTTSIRGVTPVGPQVSWVAVLILVFSMISPARPRPMLIASLVAASMDPLVTWLFYLNGQPVLAPATAFLFALPNYISAVLALVPSKVFHRLGVRLREAQDLGSYHLVELLGQGGMGEVWRAEHRLLARSAAVKLVRPEVLSDGNEADARLLLRRFEREARATASLSSPHTIQIFDFGTTKDGNFYYVMELLSGRDLESLVREFGPLSADRAMFLLRQICHSLADAHARGMVHRDIKPANIYVCRMGLEYDFVKVLDFGLVKLDHRDGREQTLLTQDHQTSGTPAYMAPEVILGEDVDPRADVYALGCVMYYLLTGQLVFEGSTPMKILTQHVQATPVPPSQRTELPIPPQLDDLVMSCLQKDPNMRPQQARELFPVTSSSRNGDGWTQDLARRWWEQHLPQLTGPLTVSEASPAATRAAMAIH